MAHWVLMKHASCARNRSIAVLLDLHKEGPESCIVVAGYRDITFYMSEYLTKELAYDRAEELELCFAGPEGDSSWSSVLQRASDRAHNRHAYYAVMDRQRGGSSGTFLRNRKLELDGDNDPDFSLAA
jgi:hypothetical protein